jgi:hypothetical protein
MQALFLRSPSVPSPSKWKNTYHGFASKVNVIVEKLVRDSLFVWQGREALRLDDSQNAPERVADLKMEMEINKKMYKESEG